MDVKAVRKLVGLSQSALAVRAGIDRSRISMAENGYTELRPVEQEAIRRAIALQVREQNAQRRTVLEQSGIAV